MTTTTTTRKAATPRTRKPSAPVVTETTADAAPAVDALSTLPAVPDSDTVTGLLVAAGEANLGRIDAGIVAMIALDRAMSAAVPTFTLDRTTGKAVEFDIARLWPTLGAETAVRYLYVAAKALREDVPDSARTLPVARAIHGAQARGVGIAKIREVIKAAPAGVPAADIASAVGTMVKPPRVKSEPTPGDKVVSLDIPAAVLALSAALMSVDVDGAAKIDRDALAALLGQTYRLAIMRGIDPAEVVAPFLADDSE